MSTDDLRPPPCKRCNIVESAYAPRRHTCNPTSVQAMQLGVAAVSGIGAAIRDAFAVFRR